MSPELSYVFLESLVTRVGGVGIITVNILYIAIFYKQHPAKWT